MFDYFLSLSSLLLGFVFAFFLTGSLVVESFFHRLSPRIKFPLYFVLSVIVSTYIVYLVGIFFGLSRFSILLSFSLVAIFLLPYSFRRIIKTIKFYFRQHFFSFIVANFVFILFFLSLYPAIFTWHNGYIVMSSVNWQDTAMHLGIIQSISQGNFPPQAPYYAGAPLHYYYYFVDFHSAILTILYGKFFPRVLVYDNPFFSFMLFLSLYALSYELIRRKSISLISAFTGSFFGSYIFLEFIKDLLAKPGNSSLFERTRYLLTYNTYSMRYEELFQMANLADYFLQNRPMMIGIPSVLIVLTLLFYAFEKQNKKAFFLSGVITGLLFRFQLFAMVSLILLFFLLFFFYTLFFKKRKTIGEITKFLLLFLLPITSFYLLFNLRGNFGGQDLISLLKDNFSVGPWEKDRDFFWHLKFASLNFGLPFVITLLIPILRLKLYAINKKLFLFSFLTLVFFAIPYFVRFTIYKGDMFKFFYFAVLFSVITTFWFLEVMLKRVLILGILIFLIVITSITSSFLTLANSFLNKNSAYSSRDWEVGLWIRDNTPQKSVFLQMPTVHSSITQIGGRLRILSYINWPYSHGYNIGADNVFSRLEDINKVYSSCDYWLVRLILAKYKVDYIYYADEERKNFPEAELCLGSFDFLKKVYSQDGVFLYEVII